MPFFRRQWFFWLVAILPYLTIVALALLATGDIFYPKKGEVRSFGTANRILAGALCLLWLAGMVTWIATG